MEQAFQISQQQIAFFNLNGYLVVENIISEREIQDYRDYYDKMLDGTIDTGRNRTDLGAGIGNSKKVENITQIMWPSDFIPGVLSMSYHKRALSIARILQGSDMEMDFDMLINKAPFTNTPTPWHQDAAYWINMPDKRAVSCWLALDHAKLENGCMWYVPGSHLSPIRVHQNAGGAGSALTCAADEGEGKPVELQPGSCAFHHGATLHYSRGNSTTEQRRAYIINFRPGAMIELERSQGFDHGRTGSATDRKVRNQEFK